MSATLMGAVMDRGPAKASMCYALVAIADPSDDYGFSCPSIQTIAQKARCDERTAMRLVQALEREGWVRVYRRVLYGKGSVYLIDIAKLSVTVNPKSRKSPLHAELEKVLKGKDASPKAVEVNKPSGDKLSPDSKAPAVEDLAAPEKSGDNPQGVQVTKTAESGDKTAFPILKNRCEPLLNPNKDNTPLPPSQASGECARSAEAKTRNATGQGICEYAVDKVMRECNLSDLRLRPVIAAAMRAWHAKSDAPADCNATAELMIRRHALYADEAEVLKYTVGVRKFFAHGVWCDQRLWPYDQEKLNRARRL